jgi:hypothetical protein
MMNDGAVLRNGHESHLWRGQGLSFPEPSAVSASMRTQPGILIFSRKRKLLYMNHRASELTGELGKAKTTPATMTLLRLVSEHCIKMQDILDSRKAANIWELFQLKHVVFEAGRKILLRGFGLANRHSYDDSRIILVLEEIGLRQEHKPH